MKKSLRMLSPTFSTNRMLWEYTEKYYLPAARHYTQLSEKNMQRARELTKWKGFVRQHWGGVRIERVQATRDGTFSVGDGYEITADVRLGPIDPKDVSVEVYYGTLDAERKITHAHSLPMQRKAAAGDGVHRYAGLIPCRHSGLQGYTVRVLPAHADINSPVSTGLITWR